jgi:hypothetical protein
MHIAAGRQGRSVAEPARSRPLPRPNAIFFLRSASHTDAATARISLRRAGDAHGDVDKEMTMCHKDFPIEANDASR